MKKPTVQDDIAFWACLINANIFSQSSIDGGLKWAASLAFVLIAAVIRLPYWVDIAGYANRVADRLKK